MICLHRSCDWVLWLYLGIGGWVLGFDVDAGAGFWMMGDGEDSV